MAYRQRIILSPGEEECHKESGRLRVNDHLYGEIHRPESITLIYTFPNHRIIRRTICIYIDTICIFM